MSLRVIWDKFREFSFINCNIKPTSSLTHFHYVAFSLCDRKRKDVKYEPSRLGRACLTQEHEFCNLFCFDGKHNQLQMHKSRIPRRITFVLCNNSMTYVIQKCLKKQTACLRIISRLCVYICFVNLH